MDSDTYEDLLEDTDFSVEDLLENEDLVADGGRDRKYYARAAEKAYTAAAAVSLGWGAKEVWNIYNYCNFAAETEQVIVSTTIAAASVFVAYGFAKRAYEIEYDG